MAFENRGNFKNHSKNATILLHSLENSKIGVIVSHGLFRSLFSELSLLLNQYA